MANPQLTSISLFSGVGMLDEGIRLAFEYLGIGHRTIAYCEREAFAASQLIALMEAGCLDEAPVWSDVTTFPARDFRGLVDGIHGGFPCQDISIAGKGVGLDGSRSGLFFVILDRADDCGAWFLILENVTAIATANATAVDETEGELTERAAARVLGELADRGWDAEWRHIPASGVGASHQRDRWFCVAVRKGRGFGKRGQPSGGDGFVNRSNPELAHAQCSAGSTKQLNDSRERADSQARDGSVPCIGGNNTDGRVADARCEFARGLQHKRGPERRAPDDRDCGKDLAHPDWQSRDVHGWQCARVRIVARDGSEVADAARNVGDGLVGEGGRGRRVCEVSGAMGYTQDANGRSEQQPRGTQCGRSGFAGANQFVADAGCTGPQGSELAPAHDRRGGGNIWTN